MPEKRLQRTRESYYSNRVKEGQSSIKGIIKDLTKQRFICIICHEHFPLKSELNIHTRLRHRVVNDK